MSKPIDEYSCFVVVYFLAGLYLCPCPDQLAYLYSKLKYRENYFVISFSVLSNEQSQVSSVVNCARVLKRGYSRKALWWVKSFTFNNSFTKRRPHVQVVVDPAQGFISLKVITGTMKITSYPLVPSPDYYITLNFPISP